MIDAKVLYWTAAWLNLAVLVGLALAGVRSIRRGEVGRHRRLMSAAAGLVALFLGSYAVKLAVLGRETLSAWHPYTVAVLRIHEVFVLLMVVGGVAALVLARMGGLARAGTGSADRAPLARWHRRAGRTALVGAVLGVATALYVLGGMYRRADRGPAQPSAASAPAPSSPSSAADGSAGDAARPKRALTSSGS